MRPRYHLASKVPGVVTAGDIECDSHVEIINPEHVIATISGKAALEHAAEN